MDGSQISFAPKELADLAIAHQVEVNPLTGAAVVSVPLALTPGRAGFGPSLALQYSSSGGNSAYGVGWSLAGLPSIGLTSKQHPKYDGKDHFVFNGTDELVLIYPREDESWPSDQGDYRIRYYRSKTEQSFTRFEQWMDRAAGRMHWVSRNRDGVVSIYGLRPDGLSRVTDPKAPEHSERTYLWLVEAQYDGRGNAIHYEYLAENTDNLDLRQAAERDRVRALGDGEFPQRYLKRVRYGNTKPLRADTPVPPENDWLFEAVFDYGDHEDDQLPSPTADRAWPVRADPYSSRRPGFEVRTYRLCHRVLMFHRFEELGQGATLVGSTAFEHHPDLAGTTLDAIGYTGYRRDADNGQVTERSIPRLRFEYASPSIEQSFQPAPEQTRVNFPYGLVDARYRWIDLYGEGLPGILTETNQAWYFKPNLGGGNFGAQQKVAEKPSQMVGSYALSDFDRDGNLDLVVLEGRQAGYCAFDRHKGQWQGFRPFSSAPHIDTLGSKAQWLDLNGDGLADILITRQDHFTWYPSEGKEGFGSPVEFAKPRATAQAQTIREDLNLDLLFADMTGDGLLDQVRIQNGRVEYWPQLGHGRFGDSVAMEGAPRFDHDAEFDLGRLRLADLDGSGTADLLYIGRGEIRYWINAGGNGFVAGGRLAGLPYIDDLSTVQVLDFLGDGTPCLVWSSPLATFTDAPVHYLRLTLGDLDVPGLQLPRLLRTVDNGMGQETELVYASSSAHYLRDKAAGRGWISKLPSHTTVVDRKEVKDLIGGSRLVSRYEYHDGHFDGKEREFRGFGLVDQFDAEPFTSTSIPEAHYTQPSCVRTWFHNGAFGWEEWRMLDYYSGDSEHPLLPAPAFEGLPELGQKDFEAGYRALAGQPIRREVYAVSPEGQRAEHPYRVTQTTYRLRRLQPARGEQDPCVTFFASETLSLDYEQAPQDPRVVHSLTFEVDAYGNACQACTVGYPRRSAAPDASEAQRRHYVSVSRQSFVNIDQADRYELGIPTDSKQFELIGIPAGNGSLVRYGDLQDQLGTALATPRDFHEALDSEAPGPQARLVAWQRSFYWNADASAVANRDEVVATQIHCPTLPHHQETACFDPPLIDEVFGARVDPGRLTDEGRYVLADGYWWQTSPVQHYFSEEGFFSLAREERPDGGTTSYAYVSPYYLTLSESVDAMGNRTRADIDYHQIAPHRIIDPNDNTAEVRYDPLGMILVSTSYGTLLSYDREHNQEGPPVPYGNDPLSAYSIQSDENWDTILAEPERFVQNAGHFLYYELDNWQQDRSPLRSISLVREELLHDGQGNWVTDGRIQTALAYVDGYGRTLQSKQRVEPGPAITRDESGRAMFEPGGLPVETDAAERWLVSGHTVYNNKQQAVRQYEPFFSPVAVFEPDRDLETYGVSSLYSYDALGRQIRQDFPNRTLARTETTPWEVRSHDPNDTVEESLYRIERETRPRDDPERQALDQALAHAGTPSLTGLDPLGREMMQIQTVRDAQPRMTESRLDSQGNVEAIVDPRSLTAFSYRRDMLGRVLHEHSIDAGDAWTLPDAQDRTLHRWDGRGVHTLFSYDQLDRPTSVHVDGSIQRADGILELDHRVERLFYGDDPSLEDAELRNARGRLVEHYDQAGRLAVRQYDPEGNPLRSERQVRRLNSAPAYDAEPDWRDVEPSFGAPYSAPADLEPAPYLTLTAFDALGRAREQSLPDHTTRTFDYLPSGGITQVRVTAGETATQEKAVLVEATYNARGQRTYALLGNGAETIYDYDRETFRLRKLTTTREEADANGNPVRRRYQDIEYTYDPVGNITRLLDHAQERAGQQGATQDVLQGLNVSPRCDYTYDAFYQLTQATGRMHQALEQHDYRSGLAPPKMKGTHHLRLNNAAAVERYCRSYAYDIGGNIEAIHHHRFACDGDTSLNWTQPVWVSETSNRSLPAEDLNGIPIANPEDQFDPNGNCIRMPHLRAMDWNYRNNLARSVIIDRSAEGRSDDAEYYVYGADGMRTRKVSQRLISAEATGGQEQVEVSEKIYLDGCEIKRVHRNGDLMLERMTSHITDGTNRIALLHQWTVDNDGREIDDIEEKKTHYQLSNHQGSSSLEVNEHGEVISYEEYFPFGGTAFIAGNNVRDVKLKEYRYSGKERDDATGLYYYGYRYYAPWIGNWLSPDPVGPEDSLNLYQFVSNNPVNLVDVNGLHGLRGYEHTVEEYLQRFFGGEPAHERDVQSVLNTLDPTNVIEEVPEQIRDTVRAAIEEEIRLSLERGEIPERIDVSIENPSEGQFLVDVQLNALPPSVAVVPSSSELAEGLEEIEIQETEIIEPEEGPEGGNENETRNPSGAPADSNDTPEEQTTQVHSGDGSSRTVEPNNRDETVIGSAEAIASSLASLYRRASSLASLPNRWAAQVLRSVPDWISENVAEPLLGETLGSSAVAWYQGQAQVVGEAIQGLGASVRRNAFGGGLPFLNPFTQFEVATESFFLGPERALASRQRGESRGSFAWREMSRTVGELLPQSPGLGAAVRSLPPFALGEEIGEAYVAGASGDIEEATRRAGRASVRLVEAVLLIAGVRSAVRSGSSPTSRASGGGGGTAGGGGGAGGAGGGGSGGAGGSGGGGALSWQDLPRTRMGADSAAWVLRDVLLELIPEALIRRYLSHHYSGNRLLRGHRPPLVERIGPSPRRENRLFIEDEQGRLWVPDRRQIRGLVDAVNKGKMFEEAISVSNEMLTSINWLFNQVERCYSRPALWGGYPTWWQ